MKKLIIMALAGFVWRKVQARVFKAAASDFDRPRAPLLSASTHQTGAAHME